MASRRLRPATSAVGNDRLHPAPAASQGLFYGRLRTVEGAAQARGFATTAVCLFTHALRLPFMPKRLYGMAIGKIVWPLSSEKGLLPKLCLDLKLLK